MNLDNTRTLHDVIQGLSCESVNDKKFLEAIQIFLKEGKNIKINEILYSEKNFTTPNIDVSDAQTPLNIAAQYIGSTKLVKILIEAGAVFGADIFTKIQIKKWNEPINQQLYDPIKNNDIEEIKRLILKGLDRDDQKCTPLLMVAKTGNVEILSLLINTHRFSDEQNQVAAYMASYNNNIPIVDYFASFDDELDIDELYWSAFENQNFKMMEYYLNIKYKPYKNHMRKSFQYLLLNIIQSENVKVLGWLLRNGADPNEEIDDKNSNFQMPLAEAYKTNNKEIIKILLDAGAKL